MSCVRNDLVKQMMSGLSAVAWIERCVRLDRKPHMIEVLQSSRKGEEGALGGCRMVVEALCG